MRRVVSTLATLAAAATASPLQSSPFSSSITRAVQPLNSTCLDTAGVPYVDANSPDWGQASLAYNLNVPVTPNAIVYATTTQHIQDAVRCAVEGGLKVAAKSGGHSYASMGLGGEDGHLVIQLDRMYGVEVRDDGTALINAGSRVGYTTLELFEQGERALAMGSGPSVGIGGHVTHGGYGFATHPHGLALDAIIGANVVLADGSLVHASETENPDLFWALRGAGSDFGIVVDFEFNTWPAPEQSTWFTVPSDLATGTREEAVAGLLALQDILEKGDNVPPELHIRMSLNVKSMSLDGVFYGNKEDARVALEPLTKPMALNWNSTKTSIEQGGWIDNVKHWAGMSLNVTYPYEGHDNSYTTSLMAKSIPEPAMKAFVDFWFDQGNSPDADPWWMLMDVHGGPSSAVTNIPMDATSYAHRDKLWLFQVSCPKFDDEKPPNSVFVNGFMDSIKDNMEEGDWGRYVNYVDSELTREEAVQQYWGTHVTKLAEIKARFDPTDLFSNPQSIKPASGK